MTYNPIRPQPQPQPQPPQGNRPQARPMATQSGSSGQGQRSMNRSYPGQNRQRMPMGQPMAMRRAPLAPRPASGQSAPGGGGLLGGLLGGDTLGTIGKIVNIMKILG